jgi:gas vesicle protein
MNGSRDDGIFKFISGLFLGILGGFLTGILMAEKPGRELRKDFEIGSGEVLENVKGRLESLRETASAKFKDFKGFTDERLKASALSIQDQVISLGKQLEELTHRSCSENKDN